MPKMNTNEKSTMIPVPKANNANAAKNVLMLVRSVLERVRLIE